MLFVAAGVFGPAAPQAARAADTIVDLSHAYGPDTIYWPTAEKGFEHTELAYGETPGGYFYSAYALATAEHGGTHMDAPIHFFAGRRTVDQIPVGDMVLPVRVIDVSARAAAEPAYRLTVADITAFEAAHGPVPAGSAVLMRTDWSKRWPDTKAYMGDDTPGDASNLMFPGFGAEAARLLVARGVKMIGVDTASIDHGPSTDFMVHRVVADANIPALENLTNLADLPPTGATLIALPMKITGGSGGPARVIALIPEQDGQETDTGK